MASMTRDLLLEIGTEELPAVMVEPSLDELQKRLLDALKAARLQYESCTVFGTPRRLALIVNSVSERQPDEVKEVSGPPARAAFDAQGRPTRAAEGFARGQGVSVEDLRIVDTPKGQYVTATIHETGQDAQAILPGLLRSVVGSIHFKKSMRWGDVGVSFARPIHWITSLFGESVIDFSYGDVRSSNKVFGHRFMSPGPQALVTPAGYTAVLEDQKVLADIAIRRERVLSSAREALEKFDPNWQLREDSALLDEVTQLVEWPVPIVGTFDSSHLDLPAEVLVSEMRHHQRYFSVIKKTTGELAPAFVAISNTEVRDPEVVRGGYEKVLAARLADARYFFDTDRARRLADRVDGLDRVVFQEKLGSILDKVKRVKALSISTAGHVGLKDCQGVLSRSVTLCKADLTTGMVGEFPDLQGVMGRYYALADGESEAVASAIEEHYLPRHAGDRLPLTPEGSIVAICDRLDTIVGLFGIEKPPTGTADPFGLRRACLGIVAIVLDRSYRLSLSAMIGEALGLLGDRLSLDVETTKEKILDFFRGRLRNLWISQDYPIDVVDAVLKSEFDDVVSALERIDALSEIKLHPGFLSLAVAFTRASNIVSKSGGVDAQSVDVDLFESEAERSLWAAIQSVQETVHNDLDAHNYSGALQSLIALRGPVDSFFEGVLVMHDDSRVRDNRLLLLSNIVGLFGRIADFSMIRSEVAEVAEG